jgi:cytoskeleton protein RodZ
MAKFTPSQVEELKLIGAYLSQQRELRSLTIEDISAGTFVRPSLLKAIETGNVETLPESIYVQGFIRRYGDFLGLNGQELAHRLPRVPLFTADDLTPEMVALPADPESPESLGAVPRDRSSKVPNRPLRSENPILLAETDSKTNFWTKLTPYSIYFLILLAAIAVLYSLFFRPKPQLTPSAIAPTPALMPTVSENAPNLATPTPTPIPTPSTLAASPHHPPLNAKVALTADAWLKVEVDGKKVYEGVLSQGATQTWSASQILKIRSGNAGAVNLSVNQEMAKPLGNLGEVKEVVLEAQP